MAHHKASTYRITVFRCDINSGGYITAVNIDFKPPIEVRIPIPPTYSPAEITLTKVRAIDMVETMIAQRLAHLDRNNKPHPTPLTSSEVLSRKPEPTLSLRDACHLLGEPPHTVRRLGDAGALGSVQRTHKGHRRYLRSHVEEYLTKGR